MGVGLKGTVAKVEEVEEEMECCSMADQENAKGWTFVAHGKGALSASAAVAAGPVIVIEADEAGEDSVKKNVSGAWALSRRGFSRR